jgi:ABC-type transport system involved in resistance to organic solvents, periplasmic component
MRGGRVGSLAASPTLVGAVTVLVIVVAVFLSYQANQGLPFVPTYKLSAELPNADTLVPGNDVRIGGIRVGQVKTIEPETVNNAPCPNDPTRQCTTQVAKVNLELNQNLNPLPENSTVVVRSKSALGLKYLEIDRGNSSQGFSPGATMPVAAARPEPVEIDQVFNMFDDPTRTAIQTNLLEFGNALAGRGVDLNEAIGQLKPLVQLLTPVMKNLADPNTGLSNFVSSLSATAAEVAPVAEIQGQLFVDLDTTFAAFARVSRPFIQDAISKAPAAEQAAITALPTVRPFLANTAKLFGELRPGFHALAPSQKPLGQSIVEGVKALALAPAFNAQLDPTAQAVLNLSNNAGARQGINDLTELNTTLGPPLSFITPAQSVCNYASILFSNAANLASYNDGIGNGQRFIVLQPPITTPNSAVGPSSAPANGGTGQATNFLHYNPYPNTASPGQTRECEAGNEGFPAGVSIGNVPGNQGINTSGQILQQVQKKKSKKKGKK